MPAQQNMETAQGHLNSSKEDAAGLFATLGGIRQAVEEQIQVTKAANNGDTASTTSLSQELYHAGEAVEAASAETAGLVWNARILTMNQSINENTTRNAEIGDIVLRVEGLLEKVKEELEAAEGLAGPMENEFDEMAREAGQIAHG